MGSKVRAAAVCAAVSALVATGATVLTAAPAAASTITESTAGSWAYVDSAAPRTSFTNPAGDLPVGAHTYANGVSHVSKAYVTFDLSALRGNRLERAGVSIDETAVADCSTPRATQLWLTEPAKKPTWNSQPAELVQAGGPIIDTSCPARGVFWNATAALQSALDAGQKTATLAIRLPDDQQNDPKFGRAYNPHATLSITYNRAPLKPAQLTVNTSACTAKPVVAGAGSTHLGAAVTDPDGDFGTAEWALWPVDHPEQRVTIQNSFTGDGVSLDVQGRLADATTYAWQVRVLDRTDAGPWSAVCKLTTDFVRPDKAPVVTSADYYEVGLGTGGTGIPGSFTFTANGVADVVGYYYGLFDTPGSYVPATRKGGPATVTVVPQQSGPQYLSVWSVDAAGARSDRTDYRFWVASNEPGVACTPWDAYVGEARQCTFTPNGPSPATAYVYHLGQDDDRTVPAGPDGTATVTVVPTDYEQPYPELTVRAKLANGYVTGPSTTSFSVEAGEPEITPLTANPVQGRPAQFRVHATLPGAASVTYRWQDQEWATAPVDENGDATVTVTPATASWGTFIAHNTTAAGIRSGDGWVNLDVASNQPAVTSAEYPANDVGSAVGTPGTFVFSSPVAGAVSYGYEFDGGPSGTVAAGPSGTASVVFTPTRRYPNSVRVTTTFADGVVSAATVYTFTARSAAPTVTCDTGADSVRPEQHVQCSVQPLQANPASYGYAIGSGAETVVPASADGTASFGFDVPADQPNAAYLTLRTWSVNAAGVRSDETTTLFYVWTVPGSARAV
ncbi:DNRLRE domain-containing protein [Amycolatopsis sp. MEPSY49]|uniref:DNRLRE domain-containing protein n=1 Tax=Amycolatopsis sp. MEPSY49 TaxID=3151600 RepID=UPI003EF3ACB3